MESRYKYNKAIYGTEEELIESHENITCIGHEPILEKYIEKIEKPDPEDVEKIITVEVEKERKIGNTFIYVDKTIEHVNNIKVLELKKEKSIIIKWYKSRDYYFNKVTAGEWEVTDPRYIEYLGERPAKAKRLDEIEAEIIILQ